jgi:hypothetical protein
MAYGAINNHWTTQFVANSARGQSLMATMSEKPDFDEYIKEVWEGSRLQPYDVMVSLG